MKIEFGSDLDNISVKCAENLFNEMVKLDNKDDVWVHTAKTFLPANVICDYSGERGFKNLLIKTIRNTLANYEN